MSTTINPAGVNPAGVSTAGGNTIGANAMKLRAEQPAETSVTGNVLNQKAEQPIEAPAAETPAFRGKEKFAKNLADQVLPNAKKLTPEQAFMEKVAGMSCAANTKDPAVLKETVLRETALGNFDFVSGINEYLAKCAAKGAYKK